MIARRPRAMRCPEPLGELRATVKNNLRYATGRKYSFLFPLFPSPFPSQSPYPLQPLSVVRQRNPGAPNIFGCRSFAPSCHSVQNASLQREVKGWLRQDGVDYPERDSRMMDGGLTKA